MGERKNNDWIIKGFEAFLKSNLRTDASLILFEYGPDVKETKDLIRSLRIENHIIWAPIMSRKEIMCLMDFCHAAIGELVFERGASWGGAGWEILSKSLPFLTSFNFGENEFENAYGFPKPPLYQVKNISNISSHLEKIYKNNSAAMNNNRTVSSWFEKNMGIGAAKNLAGIADKIYREKLGHQK